MAVDRRGNPKIVISMITWDRVLPEFVWSWTELWATVIHEKGWNSLCIPYGRSGSLLPEIRNMSLASCLKEVPDLTHFLFLDSDVIGLRAKHVRRLVEHGFPIVSCLVTHKVEPYSPACSGKDNYEAVVEELGKQDPGIIPRDWVGTGAVLIRRDVLDAMRFEATQEDGKIRTAWFRTGRRERPSWKEDMENEVRDRVAEVVGIMEKAGEENRPVLPDELAVPIFSAIMTGRQLWEGGNLTGEDCEFGLRAKLRGYQSYLDCGIQLDHVGPRSYGVKDFLETREAGQKA